MVTGVQTCALPILVNGKEKGYIWLDSRQDYGGLSPEFNEKGEKLTFEMWYTDWLNKVVAPEKVWLEKSLQLLGLIAHLAISRNDPHITRALEKAAAVDLDADRDSVAR